MAGAVKKIHDKPKTGSSHKAPEGGSGEGKSRGTDGLGDHIPNQVVPTLHRVDTVPGDAKGPHSDGGRRTA